IDGRCRYLFLLLCALCGEVFSSSPSSLLLRVLRASVVQLLFSASPAVRAPFNLRCVPRGVFFFSASSASSAVKSSLLLCILFSSFFSFPPLCHSSSLRPLRLRPLSPSASSPSLYSPSPHPLRPPPCSLLFFSVFSSPPYSLLLRILFFSVFSVPPWCN